MTEYRNHKDHGETRSGATGSRYRDVPSPAKTDGVGVALRRAYAVTGNAGDDFQTLLQQLDQRTIG